MRLITLFLFISFQLIGQNKRMFEYNERYKNLYTNLNLESFHNSKKDFHLRVHLYDSYIIDIKENNHKIEGSLYYYEYHDMDRLINKSLLDEETIYYKEFTLNSETIQSILNFTDTIPSYNGNGQFSRPVFFQSKKELDYTFTIYEYKTFKSLFEDELGFITNSILRDKQLLIEKKTYKHRCSYHFTSPGFSGVSTQYSSRREQNLDLIQDMDHSSNLRHNNELKFKLIRYEYPDQYVYKIEEKQNGFIKRAENRFF